MPKVNTYFKTKTERSEEYKRYIRSKPCMICGSKSEVHHEAIVPGGIGLKCSDFETLPLCRNCHIERHTAGVDTFYNRHNINYVKEIIKYQQDYRLKNDANS